jgi:tRNA(Ile)-lysidine synthase
VVSRLVEQVEQEVATRRLLRKGQALLIAVSGGCDSMVLLHLLHELAEMNGWKLTVAHFNHQLRGRSSDADERLVRRTAEKLKLPFVCGRADVRKFASLEKLSIEMAARRLRHDFFAQSALARRIPSVALAHHADDQLELFFLRLLRGSGGEGLGGMKWRNASPSDKRIELVRPLLGQTKAALCVFAKGYGIKFREDATNHELDFQRNRVRHKLLPLLRSYQPGFEKTVLRSAELIRAEAELAMDMAREWLQSKFQAPSSKFQRNIKHQISIFKGRAGGELTGLRFEDMPVAVQRRCVQLQLMELGVNGDFVLIEKLRLGPEEQVSLSTSEISELRKKSERNVKSRTEIRKMVLRDEEGRIHLRGAEQGAFKPESRSAAVGRPAQARFGKVVIRWRLLTGKGLPALNGERNRELFDADKVGSPVVLRFWRPGDRFQPIGMKTSIKLQDFFTNQKVPRARRHGLVVATSSAGEVFWVEGQRISERFKLTKGSKRWLEWSWDSVYGRNSHIAAMG